MATEHDTVAKAGSAEGRPAPRRLRASTARLLALSGLALAIGAAAAVVLLGGGSYTIHARFHNAGQLVKGGQVQVAGRSVGRISAINVTQDGLADVTLAIDDDSVTPLRRGTRASIRAVGQAGVTNRFVDLSPGPRSAAPLADGAVLTTDQTKGIVDLDAVLNAIDAPARADVRGLIANSSQVFAGSGSRYFNRMLGRLNPAMREVDGFVRELVYDRAALTRLIKMGGQSAAAVASRREDLRDAVANSARAFGAIADERAALGDSLQRAPAVLGQGRRTLRNVSTAVTTLRPALRDVVPTAPPLRTFLRRTRSTLRDGAPVVRDVRELLPDLRASLAGLPPLVDPAVAALRATTPALERSMPILRGLRLYGPDFTLGVTNGLAGLITANYNKTGHYGRLNFVESPQTLISGLPSSLLSQGPLIPGLIGTRTGLDAVCPGGSQPPAPDKSNPLVDLSLCDPSHSIPASVNEP